MRKSQQKVAGFAGKMGARVRGLVPSNITGTTATRNFSYVSKKRRLIAHTGKPGAAELVRQLQGEFERAGIKVQMEETETAPWRDCSPVHNVAQLGAAADLLVRPGR
jgi:hypothetical protein